MSSQNAPRSSSNGKQKALRVRDREQVALDAGLAEIVRATRLLAFVTPTNAAAERARLVAELEAGQLPVPAWTLPAPLAAELRLAAARNVDRMRRLAETLPAGPLYLRRLDELALDLQLLDQIGRPKALRPLSRQRYGDGSERAFPELPGSPTLRQVAERLLHDTAATDEPKVVPPTGPESITRLARQVAKRLGLNVHVRIEKKLVSGAAAGERTMFIADRYFGAREAQRLVVHEILGHLVAAFNGREQPLGIFAMGTGGAFADQEGMCITLEEEFGLLDAARLRALAARVLTTDWVHQGASFGEAALSLHKDFGFPAARAITLCERAYRGGGVARDVVYLRSWLRVRRTLRTAPNTLDRLRLGKLGLDDLAEVEWLARERWLTLRPAYLPSLSLAKSLTSTGVGTNLETSPPSLQTSLQRLDET